MNAGGLGLALGSGSARGLAHIGVLKVFEREGLPVDLIAGTSMGALVGGAYALGKTAGEIEEVALGTDVTRLLSMVDVALPTRALMNGGKIERFIREFAGALTFEDTTLPFACVAVDVRSGQEVVLREGGLTTAIRASISTPIIFAPVERDGQLLVDGAVLNSVPTDVVRDMGADIVVAVSTLGIPSCGVPVYCNDPDDEVLGDTETPGKSLLQGASARAVSLVGDLARSPVVYQHAARSLDLMVRKLAEPRLRAADIVIAPQTNGTTSYSFHEAQRIIAAGEKAAEAAVEEIRWLMGHSGESSPVSSTTTR